MHLPVRDLIVPSKFFFATSETFRIFAPQKTYRPMDKIRISFEVDSTGPYTVQELTARAQRFVAELVEPGMDEPSDEKVGAAIRQAFSPRSAEQEEAELNRRIDDLLAGRATTIPHGEILGRVVAAI